MQPERWNRVKEILGFSLELRPDDRPEYLAKACAGDPDLLREVESLIASFEGAPDLLESPVLESKADILARKLDGLDHGGRVGPYRIMEEIGHGGMGTVYRGVRADDAYNQQVAIKVVRHGMDQDFIVRRFHQERQIMANLEHPNIARLLDGGTNAEGLPYFVMEFIEGRPIDRYCDEHALSTAERLQLFRKVCEAVQFAHDKLIIHRDVKPANILITAEGTPKLLDFGIAKIYDPDSTQTGDATATVVRLMTPEYASPEQVRGERVTSASDVYSLGVLLYELLTGHRPHRLRGRAPHEIARAICDSEPAKPSTIVGRTEEITSASHGGPTTLTPELVGKTRNSTPEKLRRLLAGDLDNIVLMAMRKEPEKRYRSVGAFSEDIRRHLEGLPVRARKDMLGYATGKFLKRHKPQLIASAALLLLAAVVGNTLWSRFSSPSFEGTAPLTTSPFTTLSGNEIQPAFSPDGSKIAYVWTGENFENYDIYIRPMNSQNALRITTNAAEDISPVWSPDGKRIAFLRMSKKETAVFVSPSGGGVHGKIADVYPNRIEAEGRHLDWSPDGKYLGVADKPSPDQPFAIYLIEAANGRKHQLTSPPRGFIGDHSPAFSPDGKSLSFVRAPSSGVTDLYVTSISGGEPRRLTSDNRVIISQTWTPDSREIIFSSNRTGGFYLWTVPAGRPLGSSKPRRLAAIGENASDVSFSRISRRLAYSQSFTDTNIWQITLTASGKVQGPAKKLISSTQWDSSAQYSPDGKRIAFRSNRGGFQEIWVSDADGRNAAQLTNFAGPLTGTPRWSPDGEWIAFDSRPQGQPEIFVMSSRGGTPRLVASSSSEDVVPSWSRDGQWIYFGSNRGGDWQVWKVPSSDGAAVQVTKKGGFAAFESPDGKYVYYAKGRSVGGLYRVPAGGGAETLVTDRLKTGFWGYWAVTSTGIYLVDIPEPGAHAGIYFLDLNTRAITRIAEMEKQPIRADSAFAVAPDGRTILYTQVDQSGSDIMIADNWVRVR